MHHLAYWKSHFKLSLLLLVLILLIAGQSPRLQAQGENCPALVAEALLSIEDVCSSMGRNESCYGFNRVDALFWEESSALTFSQPADRVPLATLQTIATAPLNLETGLWGVAALHLHSPDLPQILPGQAVMFLLMGDTTLENRVSPQEAATPIMPVEAITDRETTLYTSPLATANTLGTIPAGTHVQAIGQDDTAGWAEILLASGGHAWLEAEQVRDPETILAALPVTFGADIPPRYGPMQSFYFTTGMAGPSCNEAPDALVIQSPSGLEVSFNINNLEVHVGSTVAFTTVDAGDGSGRRVLIGVLLEGRMTILLNGQEFTFDRPGEAFALTLNEDGLVDDTSQFRRMNADPLNAWIHNACQNALDTHLLAYPVPDGACGTNITYFTGNTFELAAGFPGTLPQLGSAQNPPPPVYIPPAIPPTATPFLWPVITRPATLTRLVGGGHHLTIWTGAPGASSYRLEIYPDTTNLEGQFVSFTTTATQFDVPLDSMPSRESPGWGYFMRVIPLAANGQPIAPADQAPTVWVVRLDPEREEAPPPPPEPTATEISPNDPPRDTGGDTVERPYCYEVCDDAGVCTLECPLDCVEICQGDVCEVVCYKEELPQFEAAP